MQQPVGSTIPVPQASPPTVTAPSLPATVADPNATNTKRMTRAVLHSVQPNNSNPQTASVLLQNTMPPRPGYSLPPDFGPVYPAGTTTFIDPVSGVSIPVKGPYFNDPVTMEGGSFIYVDPDNKVVVTPLQGTSESFPSSAAHLIALHHHTGGLDADGNPAPQQIDLASHVAGIIASSHFPKMPTNTTPVLIGTPVIVLDHVGYPIFNASVSFVTDDAGTTDSPWLSTLLVVAVQAGSQQDIHHDLGKQIADELPPVAPVLVGTINEGKYHCFVGGLGANIDWALYLLYTDYQTDQSNWTLLGHTGVNPQTVGNVQGLPGVLPSVNPGGMAIPTVGPASFMAVVDFDVNYSACDSPPGVWLASIELIAQAWNLTNNTPLNGDYSSVTVFNEIDPQIAEGDVGPKGIIHYTGEFFPLPTYGLAGQPIQYKLALRFVAENGDKTALGLYPLGLTPALPHVVARQTLIGFPGTPSNNPAGVNQWWLVPNGTVSDASAAISSGDININFSPYYTDVTGFRRNLDSTVDYLDVLEIRAYPADALASYTLGGKQLRNLEGDLNGQAIIHEMVSGSVRPNAGGSYSIGLKGCKVGQRYSVFMSAFDYQGTDFSHANTANVVNPLTGVSQVDPLWFGFMGDITPSFGTLPPGTTPAVSFFAPNAGVQSDGNRSLNLNFSVDSGNTNYKGKIQFVGVRCIATGSGAVIAEQHLNPTVRAQYACTFSGIPIGSGVTVEIYYVDFANGESGHWSSGNIVVA